MDWQDQDMEWRRGGGEYSPYYASHAANMTAGQELHETIKPPASWRAGPIPGPLGATGYSATPKSDMDMGSFVQSSMPTAKVLGTQSKMHYDSNLGTKRRTSPPAMDQRPHKRHNVQADNIEEMVPSMAGQEIKLPLEFEDLGQDYEIPHNLPLLGASQNLEVPPNLPGLAASRRRGEYNPYRKQMSVDDSFPHRQNNTTLQRTNHNAFQSYVSPAGDYELDRPLDNQWNFPRSHEMAPEAFENYQAAGVSGSGSHFRRQHGSKVDELDGYGEVNAEQSNQLEVGEVSAVTVSGRYATTCGNIRHPHPLNADGGYDSFALPGSTPEFGSMALRGVTNVRGRGSVPRTIDLTGSETTISDTPKRALGTSRGFPYPAMSQSAQQLNSRMSEGRLDLASFLSSEAMALINQQVLLPSALPENVDHQPSSPDGISYPSSPEAPDADIPFPRPIRSIPMRERIAPIKREIARKPKKSSMNVSREIIRVDKKSRAEKRAQEPISPELARQVRAAQLIVSKEQEAAAAEIFGEDSEEVKNAKEKKLEKQRADEKLRRQIAKAERFEKEEARQLREQLKAQLREEEAEKARVEKHREEVRGKLRREGERKLREATEALATEEHRRKAEERIQAERQKHAAQAEERRKEKVKSTEVQAEASEVAKLKAKQEQIKKQVASLIVGRGRGASTSHADDDMDEESLFVPRVPSPIQDDSDEGSAVQTAQPKHKLLTLPSFKDSYDIHGRGTQGTARAPTNAAELWAVAPSTGTIGDYRKERDTIDSERIARGLQAARARLAARRERRKSTPPRQLRRRQQPPAKPPSKSPRKSSRKPPGRQLSSTVSPGSVSRNSKSIQRLKRGQQQKNTRQTISHSDSEDEDTASSTVRKAQTSLDNAGPSGVVQSDEDYTARPESPLISSDVNTPETPPKLVSSIIPPLLLSPLPRTPAVVKPAPTPKVFKSLVTLVSVAERQKAADIQRQKDEEKAKEKLAKTEKQKAARRRKETEKARERKRQQLLENARSKDTDMTEDELNAEVEAYMAKREKDIQKRAAKKASKGNTQDSALVNLSESSTQNPAPQSELLELQRPEGEAIPGGQQLSERESAARDTLRSLGMGRGRRMDPAFVQQIINYSDSEESEEDPDDPVPDEPTHDSLALDDDNDNIQNIDVIESPESEFVASSCHGSKSQAISTQSSPYTCGSQATSLIRIYAAMETATTDGVEGEPTMKQTFADMEEANIYTQDLAERYRAQNPKSFSERFGQDGLYQGDIDFDKDGNHSVMLYVAASIKSTADLVNFDESVMGRRYPDSTWLVTRKVESRVGGEDGSSSHIIVKQKTLSAFSDIIMANNEAYKRCFEFLRPTRPSIDHIEQHENSWGPILRTVRDNSNTAKESVRFDLEPDENQLQWVEYTRVKFKVKEHKMMGPKN